MPNALSSRWARTERHHQLLLIHMLRYGITGVAITTFQIGVFNALLASHIWPQTANIAATVIAMMLGYTVHSLFTFRGHGKSQNVARTLPRFIAANLIGLFVNSCWVWLIVIAAGLSPHWTSLPMFCATPAILFYLNRQWVFS
jgi:putative flippase GtrA